MKACQFGSFVFPHNPAEIHLSYEPVMGQYIYPAGSHKVKILEKGLRKVVCKGAFFASTPAKAKASLDALLAESHKPQLLFLPQHSPFPAVLASYSVSFTQDGCLIPYTLAFRQEVSREL